MIEAPVAGRKQVVLEIGEELADSLFCNVITEQVTGSAPALKVAKFEEA